MFPCLQLRFLSPIGNIIILREKGNYLIEGRKNMKAKGQSSMPLTPTK